MVVASAKSMRIISWNLLHGQVIPPVGSQNWQADLITAAGQVASNYKADFVSLQEVDCMQPRSGVLNQTELVAQSMGLKYWAYLPAISGTPGESWKRIDNLTQSIITQDSPATNQMTYGIGFATNQEIKKIYVKQLGRSVIGMPLLIPKDNGKGVRFIYVKDEPRVALIAELANGFTITTTHLSFVPGVNIFQLNRLISHIKSLPGEQILTGDLNLPGNIPTKVTGFKSLLSQATYPSWNPKIQFDYIMSPRSKIFEITPIPTLKSDISDHLPIGVEIKLQ